MLATAPTRWVKLSNLRAGRNPRGADFTVEDLVESFEKTPLLHNVVVRPLAGAREQFEVVAGHRRVEAARRKGWSQIEAKVVDVGDDLAEQIALEENLRRKNLDDEAGALARLVELYEQQGGRRSRRGGDRRSKNFKRQLDAPNPVARAAAASGLSVRETQRKIRIAKLGSTKVKQAFADGKVNVLEAEQIVGLPKNKQDRKLSALVKVKAEQPPEVRRLLDSARYVADQLQRRKAGSLSKATVAELEQLASTIAGAVRAMKRSSGTTRRARAAPSPSKTERADLSAAVAFHPKTFNRKLAPVGHINSSDRPRPVPLRPFVSATDLPISATCPESCVFKEAPGVPGGCYASSGFSVIKIRQLEAAAKGFTSLELVKEEARQIDRAFGGRRIPQDGARGGRDLRLHVAGDVQVPEEAAVLGAAATRWKQRGGGLIWSFTHAWREVPRSAWGPDISVLASVEHARDFLLARKQGYAAAIVVEDFKNGDRAYRLPGARSTKVIPCPAETRSATCASCRLCLTNTLFKTSTAIAFKIHGLGSNRALQALRR